MKTTHSIINVADWAADKISEIKSSFKQDLEAYGGIYLAIIETDEGWDVEIEVNEGTIAYTYRTEQEDVDKAREIANEIEKILVVSGIHVYQTRVAWEDACGANSFNYQLLSRLQADCEYYLNWGGRSKKHLWADNEIEQISKMKELHNGFSEESKPEWLTMKEIEEYERKMVIEKDRVRL